MAEINFGQFFFENCRSSPNFRVTFIHCKNWQKWIGRLLQKNSSGHYLQDCKWEAKVGHNLILLDVAHHTMEREVTFMLCCVYKSVPLSWGEGVEKCILRLTFAQQ
jgi:hypothetical protein